VTDKNANGNMSHHILPTAATLLGICFAMLSFINVTACREKTLLDEILAIATALFFGATIFSYLAVRSAKNAQAYERAADIIFLCGLALMTTVALIFTFIISF
jgi:hypothetical protein